MIRAIMCSVVLVAGTCAAADVVSVGGERSVLLTMGKPAGEMLRSVDADGTQHVHFEFNDRGRGPKLDATYKLRADGSLLEAATRGVNYFKGKVDESFSQNGSSAHWKNSAEDETRDLAAPSFYLSLEGTPQDTVLLAQALLKSPTHSLPMLPVGAAHIEKILSTTLKGKAGAVVASLYAISGLDLTPTYLWLDEQQNFFASYSPWSSLVREGFEDALPNLGKQQDAQAHQLSENRARELTQRLDHPLLIENVRIFEPGTQIVSAAQSVLVDKGHIVAVGAAISAPANAQHLDGRGRMLMPGLWDMHAHLTEGTDPLIDIAAGVTTVRDLANDEQQLLALIGNIEAARDIGPRVIRAGFIDGRGPYAGPTKVFADNETELKNAIDHYADNGYVQIKVYSSMKPELVAPAARFAHARDLRLSGHVPAFMTARQFVDAGADEIQHINFIALNFLFDKVQDTRTPARFTAVAENFADIDLGSPEVHDFVQFLKQHNTVVDPTLSTFEGMFLSRSNDPALDFAAITHRLPATWQRSIATGVGGLEVPTGRSTQYRMSYQKLIDLTGMLYRGGVRLVAGTDGTAGFSLVRELELYVAAGIAPKDALRIATLGGAEVMHRDSEFGHVAPGYVADLILVDGDPTQVMSDLRKVDVVIRGDRMFDSAALFKSLGLGPHSP